MGTTTDTSSFSGINYSTITGSTTASLWAFNDGNYFTSNYFEDSGLTHRFYGEMMTEERWHKLVNQAALEGIESLPEPTPPKSPTLIAKRFNRQQPRWSAEAWKSTT